MSGALCRLGIIRCGFNLHMGIMSKGCITVNKAATSEYMDLIDLLRNEAPNNRLVVR